MVTRREKERREIRYSDAKKVVEQFAEGFKPTAFQLPEGVPLFRFRKEKEYKLDIIPYFVGVGNPNADEGIVHFERSFYTHPRIGADQNAYCCLKKTFGKRCPVCEFRISLGMKPKTDKKLLKSLEPKWRQLYLVRDHDELEKGIQIFETAYWKSFGEMLKSKIKAGDDSEPYQNFYYLDGGYFLKVLTEEDSWEGKSFFKPSNIEMRKRKNPLDEKLIRKAPCLDDLLIELPYQELKDIFTQAPEDDDEDDASAESEEEDDDSGEGGSSSNGSSRKPRSSSTSSSKKPSQKDEDEELSDEEEIIEDDESGGSEEEVESEEESEEPTEEGEEEIEEETEEPGGFKKGDRVTGLYQKKRFKGTVKEVAQRKGKQDLITVLTDMKNTRVMDADELEPLEGEAKPGKDSPKPSAKPQSSSKPASKPQSKPGKKPGPSEPDDDENDDLPFDDEE